MALLRRSGTVNFLRVHERGTGFGPDDDHIDVEAVASLDAERHRFGVTLRDDGKLPAHEGMVALLRDGLIHDLETTVDYDIEDDRRNGILIRVELRPRS
jgi:hypothetical protein